MPSSLFQISRRVLHFLMLPAFLLLICSPLAGQTINLTLTGFLPATIEESSGLELSSGGIWTHNDSGGNPELYQIDSAGNILRTLYISGASNHDWEELAKDSGGNLYIGDFGNNYNARTDLRIYKISNPDLSSSDTVTAQVIDFTYSDQTEFPPAASALNYDMEAMVHAGGSLWLFSKNRTDPFTGYTRIYRLPDNPGVQTAQLVDSFFTGPGPMLSDWVTAADVSTDGQALVLMSYQKIWLFRCFTGASPLSGQMVQLDMPFSQKEGIVFRNSHEVYISDEAILPPLLTGNIYMADLSTWLSNSCCPQVSGISTLPLSSTSVKMMWNKVPSADGYRITVGPLSGGTGMHFNTSDTSIIISDLIPGTDYRANVKARCMGEYGETGPEILFSTPMIRDHYSNFGQLMLFDQNGRLVVELIAGFSSSDLTATRQYILQNIPKNLTAGLYYYIVVGENQRTSGKIFVK